MCTRRPERVRRRERSRRKELTDEPIIPVDPSQSTPSLGTHLEHGLRPCHTGRLGRQRIGATHHARNRQSLSQTVHDTPTSQNLRRSHLDIDHRRPAQTDIARHAQMIRSNSWCSQPRARGPDGQARKVGRGEQDVGRSMRDGPAFSTGDRHSKRCRKGVGSSGGGGGDGLREGSL